MTDAVYDLVRDFVDRTGFNLAYIRGAAEGDGPFEITQAINSLLGLLVLPKEKLWRRIPDTPEREMIAEGWPLSRVYVWEDRRSLKTFLCHLRNAVGHFRIEIEGGATIEALMFEDVPYENGSLRRDATGRLVPNFQYQLAEGEFRVLLERLTVLWDTILGRDELPDASSRLPAARGVVSEVTP